MKLFTEKLKPLDLKKCKTVGDIVEAMSHCSFGARMLGDVSKTLLQMITSRKKPLIVYDGKKDTPLGKLIKKMVGKKWFSGTVSSYDYSQSSHRKDIVVIGRFPEVVEEALFQKPERAVYINNYGLASPDHLKYEGYYPDVIFSDPRFAVPALYDFLLQNLENKITTISDFIANICVYGGVATAASHGAQVFKEMADDPDCSVFLTVSGAMTVGKMGLIISDMIDMDMIQYFATTGALMAHGFVENVGLKHYKYNPQYDDTVLARHKINRVTDTLEPETNLNSVEKIMSDILDGIDAGKPIAPSFINQVIGEYLAENYPKSRGILKSAFEMKVPVFIPAFVDSEIGNDVYLHNEIRGIKGKPKILIDMELDTKNLIKAATKAKKIGIFTIGGGVPRNNIQNVSPLIEIINNRLNLDLPKAMFNYGCRICPDPPYHGHLSGCTYSEGMSWRKMDALGKFAEIKSDATIVWPFLVKYVMETKEKEAKKDP